MYQQKSCRPYQYLYLKLFCLRMKSDTPLTCCLACDQNLPTISGKIYLQVPCTQKLSLIWQKQSSDFLWLTLETSQHLLCNGSCICSNMMICCAFAELRKPKLFLRLCLPSHFSSPKLGSADAGLVSFLFWRTQILFLWQVARIPLAAYHAGYQSKKQHVKKLLLKFALFFLPHKSDLWVFTVLLFCR